MAMLGLCCAVLLWLLALNQEEEEYTSRIFHSSFNILLYLYLQFPSPFLQISKLHSLPNSQVGDDSIIVLHFLSCLALICNSLFLSQLLTSIPQCPFVNGDKLQLLNAFLFMNRIVFLFCSFLFSGYFSDCPPNPIWLQ